MVLYAHARVVPPRAAHARPEPMARPYQRDQELIRLALRGEPGAVEQLSRRLACVPAFVRVYNRRVGDPVPVHDLGDVTQNVLAALWAKLERFTGQASLESWAFGFSVREVRKAIDARRRSAGVALSDDGELERKTAAPKLPGGGELETVEIEIGDLGHPAADIVRHKHFDELSFPEISDRLDLPLGTVKTHYYRAMARLRVRLAPLWRAVAG